MLIGRRLSLRIAALLLVIFVFGALGSGVFIGKNNITNPGAAASAAYPTDINSDGTVGIADLSYLIGKWGTADPLADVNSDGTVNIFDLSRLISNWGAVPVAADRPDATTTGVPSGTTLRTIAEAYPDAVAKGYTINTQGRVTITKDGELYENLLFPHGLSVRAKNVIIRNSRIQAGKSSFSNLPAEPSSWDHCRSIRVQYESSGQSAPSVFVLDTLNTTVSNLLIEDSEIATSEYSIYISGFMGHDVTMRRVDISNGVDGIGVYNGSAPGANFILEDSYIHDLYRGQWSVGNYNIAPSTTTKVYCGYDAAHPEATHNDGIQTHGGPNITITGNYINAKPVNGAQSNAGIMVNAGSNVNIDGNHFQYGVCSINVVSGLTLPIAATNNTFYGNNGSSGTAGQDDNGCAIIRPAAAGYIFTNNLWEIGTPIKLTNG